MPISLALANAWFEGGINDADVFLRSPITNPGAFFVASLHRRTGLLDFDAWIRAYPGVRAAAYRTDQRRVTEFMAPFEPEEGLREEEEQVRWMIQGEGFTRLARRLARHGIRQYSTE